MLHGMSLASRIDALAQRLPHDDPRRGELRARIAALANDCGCTSGGIFLVAATVVVIGWFVAGNAVGAGEIGLAIGFVLVASFIGKGIGLAIARIRLLWLGHVLALQLRGASAPEASDVQLH